MIKSARLELIPVGEAAGLRYPAAWPPPLFVEAASFPDEREFVIAQQGAALGMIALGPPGARVEVGYAVLEKHRGQGVASEALAALVEWALADPRTREVFARVQRRAPASIRVLQKSGFERGSESEGYLIFVRRRR